MRLPAYQIYHVLQQYTRRLSRSRTAEKNAVLAEAGNELSFVIARRREIVGRVMEVIRESVGRVRPAVARNAKIKKPADPDSERPVAADNGKLSSFVYNLIGRDQRKVTRTISVEAPGLIATPSEKKDGK